MRQPEITDDQREMAIVLLANAMRADAHLRDRAHRAGERAGGALEAGLIKRRFGQNQPPQKCEGHFIGYNPLRPLQCC